MSLLPDLEFIVFLAKTVQKDLGLYGSESMFYQHLDVASGCFEVPDDCFDGAFSRLLFHD